MDVTILFEDEDIIVCEKPAGVPSQSDKTTDYDMVNRLKNYVYEKGNKKIQPYIGIVHRLDRPVGGVMVFAKTPIAAKVLSSEITQKKFIKKYYAVVTKDLSKEKGQTITLVDYIEKDGRTNLSKIVNQSNKNAKKAELKFKVLDVIRDTDNETENSDSEAESLNVAVNEISITNKDKNRMLGEEKKLTLIEVELITGRHHQIRVQMSHAGAGLWGDTKYNEEFITKKGWFQIALYSYSLSFEHPITKKRMTFERKPKTEIFAKFH